MTIDQYITKIFYRSFWRYNYEKQLFELMENPLRRLAVFSAPLNRVWFSYYVYHLIDNEFNLSFQEITKVISSKIRRSMRIKKLKIEFKDMNNDWDIFDH